MIILQCEDAIALKVQMPSLCLAAANCSLLITSSLTLRDLSGYWSWLTSIACLLATRFPHWAWWWQDLLDLIDGRSTNVLKASSKDLFKCNSQPAQAQRRSIEPKDCEAKKDYLQEPQTITIWNYAWKEEGEALCLRHIRTTIYHCAIAKLKGQLGRGDQHDKNYLRRKSTRRKVKIRFLRTFVRIEEESKWCEELFSRTSHCAVHLC